MFRMTAMLCVRPVLRSLHIQLEWNLKTNFLTSSKANSFFLVQIFRSSKINIINESIIIASTLINKIKRLESSERICWDHFIIKYILFYSRRIHTRKWLLFLCCKYHCVNCTLQCCVASVNRWSLNQLKLNKYEKYNA